MDSTQRKKLQKRSTKRQFKQSPVLNLYILLLSIFICFFELFKLSSLLMILRPFHGILLCYYIFHKLPQTRNSYIFTKIQLLLLFHEEQSPSKLIFYVVVVIQQIINIVLLREKVCTIQISILHNILLYLGSISLVVVQVFLIKYMYAYIRISQYQYLYFIAFIITLTVIISIFRLKYSSSRSYWFCLVSNLMIWFSLNLYCYQQLIGQKEGLLSMIQSLCGGVGNFILMHGFVLHFIFNKMIMKEDD